MARLTADVSDEPSWIHDDDFNRPRFFRDLRCNRELVAQLRQVLVLNYGHRPKRWGFAIVRTVYGSGSDEQFQLALALIDRIARVYAEDEAAAFKSNLERKKKNNPIEPADIPIEVDLRPNEEMVRRYENDVLEDAAQLEDASVATTLAQLATVPDDFPPSGNTGYKSPYWVKMVEAKSEPEDAFRTRVFGKNDLVDYWFARNYNRRAAVELIQNQDPENPGAWYFGTPPPVVTLYSPPL
ncbi:hypothetical protein QQX98_006211 [Neonectria punicea]|uniref:Uncharacterized protein n=1 Tax=Neonectria punicea TaxID=979145 RepID=A0ABR1H208_9HYPO